jgi:phage terminase large subunit-like protein
MNGEIWRPTLILVDDLEDDKALKNDELRKETADWMYGPVCECIDQDYQPSARSGMWNRPKNDYSWLPPWRIIYVDTLKHNDAFMNHILNSSDWYSVRLPQSELRLDADGKKRYYSLVLELISNEQVRAQVNKAERTGKLDVYCREKMCIPMSPTHASWTNDMFKRYRDRETNLSNNKDIVKGIIVDPARTANRRSAFSAILGIAVDLKAGKFYMRDLINRRMEDREIIEKTFEMAIALRTRWIAIESAGLGTWGMHAFKNEAERRNLGVEFIELNASSIPRASEYSSIKEARAAQMLPYYQMGHVYHEEVLTDSALERQMLQYPLCSFWDAIDCAGYIPQFLEKARFYFEPQVEDRDADYFGDRDGHDAMCDEMDTGDWMTVHSPFESYDMEGVLV